MNKEKKKGIGAKTRIVAVLAVALVLVLVAFLGVILNVFSGEPSWTKSVIGRTTIHLSNDPWYEGELDMRYIDNSVNAKGEPFAIYLAIIPDSKVWAKAYVTVLQKSTKYIVGIASLTSSTLDIFYDSMHIGTLDGKVEKGFYLTQKEQNFSPGAVAPGDLL